jgi:glycosyltransferase involved in cell wall biosynthesis
MRELTSGSWSRGDGPLRSRLASRLTDLSLDSSVTLAGFLPREEFLARVHAVVLCSRIENLPYAMLEAMAWSRPVIATRVGGMPEVIEDGVTGWLVEPDDVAALAAHFARLAVSPESGRVSGVAGRERLALRFSLGAMVGAHRTLYAALTAPEAAASRTHPRLPADG